MANSEPVLERLIEGDGARIRLSGDWTASHTDRLERLVAEAPKPGGESNKRTTIDVAEIRRLDTFGAWAIESLRRAAPATASIAGADPARRAILAQFERARLDLAPSARPRLGDRIESIGRWSVGTGDYLGRAISLLGELVTGFFYGLRHPHAFRLKSLAYHLDRAGAQAAPIIILMNFLIGLIVAQQGLFYFRRFGATDYVVDLVTVLVLRELGVLLVTIMLAGRSGSSYAAEIGSMKMREEIDALRTMELSPAGLLVLPRVMALVIAAPLLTMLGIIAALYGAGLVMWINDGMAPLIFLSKLREAATHNDFIVGMVKAPVMALMIGIIAALEGFAVEGSTESLGVRTTASVVKSIFFVIVLDGIFAVLFTSLGM